MRESVHIAVSAGANGFAEDKDEARELRKNEIMPALLANKRVVLDFCGVTSSTQSFVHALIREPLQKIGEGVLERLEFRSCAPQIKSLVELVVDYSLSGFGAAPSVPVNIANEAAGRKRKTSEKPVSSRPSRRRKAH